MCYSAEDTHHKLLDRVVSGARFLTWGVFECDVAHRRSLAVLCKFYRFRCNPMHHHYGALPVPFVPVRVTRGAFVGHRYTFASLNAEPRSFRGPLFYCQRLCGTIFLTKYSMV